MGIFSGIAQDSWGNGAALPAVRIRGVINPVLAEFVTTALDAANRNQAPAFLI